MPRLSQKQVWMSDVSKPNSWYWNTEKEIYEYQLQLLEQQAASTQSARDREKVTQTSDTAVYHQGSCSIRKTLDRCAVCAVGCQGTEVDDADNATDFSLDRAPVSLTQGISAYLR